MRLEDFQFLLQAFLGDESVKQLSNVSMLTARWILGSVLFNYAVTRLTLWDFSLSVCLFVCFSVVCLLFKQDSAQESVITRDIHRTFPAHDYFKDTEGDGQESLYKICKVQSVL